MSFKLIFVYFLKHLFNFGSQKAIGPIIDLIMAVSNSKISLGDSNFG